MRVFARSVLTVSDTGVSLTVGRGGGRVRSLRSHSVTDSEGADRSTISSVGTSVSLSKGRGGTVGLGVDSWWVGGIGVTLGERVVGVAKDGISSIRVLTCFNVYSLSWHDPLATHLVKSVLAL